MQKKHFIISLLILSVFGKIDYLKSEHQVKLIKLLLDVINNLDKEKTISVYNNIKRSSLRY